jgi:serine/threonine protein kinase
MPKILIPCSNCGEKVPERDFCDQCGSILDKKFTPAEATIAPKYPEKKESVVPRSSEGKSNSLLNGRYEVRREVGKGGMGVVLEAFDVKLKRPVALKKMREEIKLDPKGRRKFLEEAARTAKLTYPLIVTLYEYFEENGDIYLVFEYVEGKTLSDILAEKNRLKIKDAVDITLQICDAIGFAHGKGVLHRDLKPTNVMMTSGKHLKVMDFGIAAEAHSTFSRISGKDSSGSPPYMAPEQEMGEASEKSDIFSVGVCLYEMLTGDLPFPGPNFLAQKERMKFKPVRESMPEVPKELEMIVTKCFQTEPAKRYQSMGELAKAMENF